MARINGVQPRKVGCLLLGFFLLGRVEAQFFFQLIEAKLLKCGRNLFVY